MKPHTKCIEESKKRCWCITDYVEEAERFKRSLPSEEEIFNMMQDAILPILKLPKQSKLYLQINDALFLLANKTLSKRIGGK